ncbi:MULTISPECIES: plasmid replication protein RepC [unclassified Ruegeria]|uniref:plasmid replication protein RepC n=1 Tax=unclassified Ruegeria TaxID=2625375 RepID=UPI001489AFDC|nr:MULTISPECIES: plasmid replication protein RepC [unclassified Ruegeria]NOD85933.1 replication protein C [Ruegeria sp. HKCCD6119]
MPGGNQPSGWRKATAGLAVAERHAKAGERVAVPKTQAFVAVKRVGAHIGLKAGDMLLLDTLGAFTQGQDWEEGQRPIVWASNAYLVEQTGFSLSALKRHARRLAEIGVISFKDSPNGKRWGHRDADGRIIEAYGFDLSPLSARVEEFEQLHTELQAERELCQRLKRQITVARRMIRARIEAASHAALRGPWEHLAGLFEDLLGRLPRRNTASGTLERLLAWFRELQERVEATYLNAIRADEVVENTAETTEQVSEKTQELNPREVNSEPHILITTQLNPVTCNRSETEQAAGVVPNAPPEERVDRELEDWVAETRKKRGAALDLPTVMQACPEFASWARNMGGYLQDWGDLHRVAGQLRPMIGVSEHAWNLAQDRLGPQIATAALVLTFDKHCAGEVASPGGYLRGIVQKAGAGELHLERSFYGRLSGQAA